MIILPPVQQPQNTAGDSIAKAVMTFIDAQNKMADQRSRHTRDMMQLGMFGQKMQKERTAEESRMNVAKALESLDFNSPDAQNQLRRLSVQAPDIVQPLMDDYRKQQQFNETMAMRKFMMGQRGGGAEQRPTYDARLGGYVKPDGSFTPVQIPEGYTPPGGGAQTQKAIYDQKRGGFVNPDGTFSPIEYPEGTEPETDLREDYSPIELRQTRNKANSLDILDNTIGLYEDAVKEFGWTPVGLDPVAEQRLNTLQRDFQMQLKELYNLGVLNGPDLALMNEIMPSATEIPANPLLWRGRKERLLEGIQQGKALMGRYKNQTDKILGVKNKEQPQQGQPQQAQGGAALPPGFKVVN